MDYQKPSFSVASPGTKSYADSHTRIFNCPLDATKLKSKCDHCKAEAAKASAERECER